MKNYSAILIILTFLSLKLQAQENTHHVFSNGGGSTDSVSYTIGESIIASFATTDSTVQLTQGFQQPQTLIITDIKELKGNISFSVFPNPVQTHLKIEIKDSESRKIAFLMVSNEGKTIEAPSAFEKIGTDSYIITISFERLPAGMYNIMLFDKKTSTRLGECKIIKIDIQ